MDLASAGIQVISTGIRFSANAVVVGVRDGVSTGDVEMLSLFGEGLLVEDDLESQADNHDCTGVSHCWPVKGGIKLLLAANNAVYCTIGWVVKRNGTSTRYVVTAGHCPATNGGVDGDDWEHINNKVGDARTHTWVEDADADVGLIQLTAVPTNRNEVLATLPDSVRKINAVRIPIEQAEGDALCRMGATSGRTCGTLKNWNVTRPSCVMNNTNCRDIRHTNEVSFDSTGGDSGGPVYQYSPTPGFIIGYGTHVHSDPDDLETDKDGWFSPIGHGYTAHFARYGWTYTVCTTTAC